MVPLKPSINFTMLQRQSFSVSCMIKWYIPITGLPVKPLVYVRRVYVPLEQQFKYLSDESSSEDEEWTEGPIKKKDDPTASKGN